MAPVFNATAALVARNESTLASLVARNESALSSLIARNESTLSSMVPRNESTLTSLVARNESTLSSLVARNESTLSSLVARANYSVVSVKQNSYADASVKMLARAATSTYTPCSGCMDPRKVNNKAFFALFALVGVAIVVTSIWFFFWAKNGGFKYEEGDWEDYKSTVLRRKGPDGKTIYSGTRSTIFNDKSDRIAARSVIGYDEKGRKGIMSKRGFGGSHSVYYSDNFTDFSGSRADDMSEVMTEKNGGHGRIRGGHASESGHHSRRYRDRDLRDYKQEKPARVGGMNRSADGTQYDYSDRSETMTERSTEPLTSRDDRKRAKAEKRAAEDAARMERKWRKEAERAAAELARESVREAPSSSKGPSSSKPPSSSKKPASSPEKQAHRSRRDSRSRSHSPKKQQRRTREYSFSGGPDETSTVYSSAYTDSTTNKSSSYYDAYRPLVQQSPRQERRASSSRHSSASPSKHHRSRHYAESEATSDSGTRSGHERRSKPRGARGGRDVMAGYRRGMDSLASDSE